ncbi:MAG: hypothetical protein JST21_17320 [Bacteroidetes bacterium]|nr:hypothetical protein [Bacteroidota bacterium]MBS1747926.1 hypothetical protein [Bacteroidota bacterium]
MKQDSILLFFCLLAITATIVFVWVFRSSIKAEERTPGIKNALQKRFWFLLILVVVFGIFASVTLPKSPYFAFAEEVPAKVIHVAALQFSFFLSEKSIDPKSPSGDNIELPLNKVVEFRVTSLDVNHGFAIYNPQMRIVTQTQAMPGYINRLRYKFTKPGIYHVLCLEYCGVGHPVMQTTFIVK